MFTMLALMILAVPPSPVDPKVGEAWVWQQKAQICPCGCKCQQGKVCDCGMRCSCPSCPDKTKKFPNYDSAIVEAAKKAKRPLVIFVDCKPFEVPGCLVAVTPKLEDRKGIVVTWFTPAGVHEGYSLDLPATSHAGDVKTILQRNGVAVPFELASKYPDMVIMPPMNCSPFG